MSDTTYKVSMASPEDVERALASIRGAGNPLIRTHRRMLLADGFEWKGSFELIARDVETGEVAWRHEQDNLVTDLGRQVFAFDGFSNVALGFAPSKESPSIGRYSLPTDYGQMTATAGLGAGTVTPSTYTRTFGPVTFGAGNRTLGTLVLCSPWLGSIADASLGYLNLLAYTNLSPPKTQTTAQTIELNYKISINPIV